MIENVGEADGLYTDLPRLVISGLSGDSGKTLVSVAVILAARRLGLQTQGFKKGPDYIDAAWLTWASGRPARNLDGFMMGSERILYSFRRHAIPTGINLIEGNRGLYDGSDSQGTHSTAELAKLLGAPVVLVVNAAKVTRTVAACVLGCQKLGPEIRIAGVVLNRISNQRHEKVVRESIESVCGIPVLGVLPRISEETLLPGRHLGLVPPQEHPGIGDLESGLVKLVESHVDVERLLAVARRAPCLAVADQANPRTSSGQGLRIGYLKDSAFTFYYPENLEALESAGAALVPLSSLSNNALPDDLDALYIGGGFPETHAARISRNSVFLASLAAAAKAGLPVFAECGGLMLLARRILWQGQSYSMAGVLPFDVEVCASPQGHGYALLSVDRPNPFLPNDLVVRGHEFHYSRIVPEKPPRKPGFSPRAFGAAGWEATACAVRRGTGCYPGRDGIVLGSVWASYTHIHALATPEWAAGLIGAARQFRSARSTIVAE